MPHRQSEPDQTPPKPPGVSIDVHPSGPPEGIPERRAAPVQVQIPVPVEWGGMGLAGRIKLYGQVTALMVITGSFLWLQYNQFDQTKADRKLFEEQLEMVRLRADQRSDKLSDRFDLMTAEIHRMAITTERAVNAIEKSQKAIEENQRAIKKQQDKEEKER
jgi:hypothetical protein